MTLVETPKEEDISDPNMGHWVELKRVGILVWPLK